MTESDQNAPNKLHRIAFVSCVKTKRATASPARDLYQSALFRGLRAYAEAEADRWYILSAEHGVLEPCTVIEPYERSLITMRKAQRNEWWERVERQLSGILPPNAQVVLLAGARYREALEPSLLARGYEVEVPLKGLGQGRQLQWLKRWSAKR
jgi:cytoplasmic iron level regulating protein YaaA (DUF328/UPF0246 family)